MKAGVLMGYAVEMLNITKTFPGIKANDKINLQLKEGEIHALLGENGAGKTTLMSILFGIYKADEGKIRVGGEDVTIRNPNDANNLGIGMVHQHFKLVDRFTVLENIILGHEDTKNRVLVYEKARKKVQELSEQYNLKVDPDKLVSDISVGHQQRVEILKMLYREAEILILDEPTASLTPQEIEELMEILQRLAKEGKSILFITHKLKEIRQVANRCTILRRGAYIDTVDVAETSNERLAEMMVGRKVDFSLPKKKAKPENTVLQVENLSVVDPVTRQQVVNDVSFETKRGEILVVAGIEGNGQSELVYGITGLFNISGGMISLNDEDISESTIRARSLKGISHIPEDRQKHGLILDFPLEYNLILQDYHQKPFQRRGFLQFDAIRNHAEQLIDRFDIRSSSGPVSIARSMSGGNQQKAILGREIYRESDLLIAVQPTRGLDVGAIEFIHRELVSHRDQGNSVLIISYDLDEVFNLADRILVMYEGENVGEFDPKEVSREELGLYMSGSKRSDKS